MKFRFNTGRQYQPVGHEFAGQVIDVEVVFDSDPEYVFIKFWDRSRNLDGVVRSVNPWLDNLSNLDIQQAVMSAYDRNQYTSIDYWLHLRAQA